MKLHFASIAGAVALASIVTSGCTREERTTTVTPPSPAAPAPGAATATPPEPPNPSSITGTTPKAPDAPGPGPAERAGRIIGEQLDDATLTAKVKTALLQAPDVKGMQVNVDSDRGAVQLSGFVESQTQIDRAVQIAKAVSGVREVHNKMTIKAGKDAAAPAAR
jgi:hyperosmotically inducible protein